MTDATTTRAKGAKAAPIVPLFEMPKFEMPKFDLPKFEVPAAFREFAEKSVAQAKDAYEKVKTATEEATDLLEDTYSTAAKGTTDYNLKLTEQTKELTALAQKVATETAEPIKTGVSKAFKQVA